MCYIWCLCRSTWKCQVFSGCSHSAQLSRASPSNSPTPPSSGVRTPKWRRAIYPYMTPLERIKPTAFPWQSHAAVHYRGSKGYWDRANRMLRVRISLPPPGGSGWGQEGCQQLKRGWADAHGLRDHPLLPQTSHPPWWRLGLARARPKLKGSTQTRNAFAAMPAIDRTKLRLLRAADSFRYPVRGF